MSLLAFCTTDLDERENYSNPDIFWQILESIKLSIALQPILAAWSIPKSRAKSPAETADSVSTFPPSPPPSMHQF